MNARAFTPTGNLPEALTERAQWLCWRYRETGGAKPAKLPCTPAGGPLPGWQNDSAKWMSFADAVTAFQQNPALAGLGFVLTGDIIGFDLDGAITEDGEILPWAQAHLDDLRGTYVEYSPSGRGFRAFALGNLPEDAPRHVGQREIYDRARWLTVTGRMFAENEVTARPQAVENYLHAMRAERGTPAPAGGNLPEGGRNAGLTALAGFMRRGGLREPEIEAALQAANIGRCARPLAGAEVSRIARSIARYAPAQDVAANALIDVDVAGVVREPSRPPRFVWSGYCPRGEVTLFAAHGGTGKSTIALMLAVAVAQGQALFGVDVARDSVLFVSLEDSGDVVRHRLRQICEHFSIAPEPLAARLHIVDGAANPELFSATRDGGEITQVYEAVRARAEALTAGLVIIDHASDAYGGDEIVRRQVRAFVRSLADIARRCDAAVLLLAHVDKATSRAGAADRGEAYSGSTAWHNSCRSRLFMRRDDALLTIEHQKANLGPLMPPLTLEWPEGALPTLAEHNTAQDRQHANATDTLALLRLIQEFSSRGEPISTATSGPTTASAVLREEPGYPGQRRPKGIHALLRAAEREKLLERATIRTPSRKTREVWQLTAKGENVARPGNAPVAPVVRQSRTGAFGAAAGGVRPPKAQGGVGGLARAQTTGAGTL